MFAQLAAPSHVLAFRLSGKVTGEDIKSYKDLLEAMLSTHDVVSLCVDVTGLSDMDADALLEGMKADLEFLSHIRQFRRGAVISDKEWPRAVIGFFSPLFPNFEMKSFAPERVDEALKWAAELPALPQADTPAVRFLPTSRDDVLAFEVDGVISEAEFPTVLAEINALFDRHDKVRLLGRIKHLGGFDPAILMQSGLIPMKLAAMRKVERYAIVGAPGWMSKMISTMNPLFDVDMRTFPAEREAEAWAWVEAEPIL
ncbi:STAS/SEC14 domain-containing protein [Aurantimonas sp. C2-6-R+9]|uniref:STAS/SEC14 domain-containing protein n=1 Tax=unclassified Aurantimonas TaxID=2638230 RepID=UPI002E18D85E|nr:MULTISPECIES: STAS/SEC14 domain-containing protein [unclassified Aurantimonas]MEC5289326.1 STAS/SEC14 domain-containing protein [Aurantimonas sp. C2-3-R2]MEC5382829.1 STAS/SEC14 domain-containing protein [Aurantimonas sp. C2-6-R+9]MEC5410406.1 STAS/SEC14 domain-containing protein [Aurantimonas sp. C2-4-R8]